MARSKMIPRGCMCSILIRHIIHYIDSSGTGVIHKLLKSKRPFLLTVPSRIAVLEVMARLQQDQRDSEFSIQIQNIVHYIDPSGECVLFDEMAQYDWKRRSKALSCFLECIRGSYPLEVRKTFRGNVPALWESFSTLMITFNVFYHVFYRSRLLWCWNVRWRPKARLLPHPSSSPREENIPSKRPISMRVFSHSYALKRTNMYSFL